MRLFKKNIKTGGNKTSARTKESCPKALLTKCYRNPQSGVCTDLPQPAKQNLWVHKYSGKQHKNRKIAAFYTKKRRYKRGYSFKGSRLSSKGKGKIIEMIARNGPDKTEIPCRASLESNLKPLF